MKIHLLTPIGGVAALSLFVSGSVLGQTSVDRAHAASTFVGGTAIGANGARLRGGEQVEVRLPLPPLRWGRQSMLIPSLGYDTRWRGRAGSSPQEVAPDSERPDDDRNFHRFQVALTYLVPLSDRWRGLLGVTGKATTDFQERGLSLSRDGTLTAFAMGMYAIGGDPRFMLTLGIASSYPWATLPAFPLVGVTYRKDPFIVELGLPRSALLLKPAAGVELGVVAAFERESFRTRFDDQLTRSDAVYLKETTLRVGPAVNVDLGASLWLSSSVGVDLMNDFALLDADRNQLGVATSTAPAPYVRLVLGWRPERRAPPPPPPTPKLVRPPEERPTAVLRAAAAEPHRGELLVSVF